ncbi:MAG: hypothetical protein LBO04_06755 [Spirochaetaceae bacterium]|jgi:hypothetical protein|nr:hypothetical protein [Spirochaetaceae bacterium]
MNRKMNWVLVLPVAFAGMVKAAAVALAFAAAFAVCPKAQAQSGGTTSGDSKNGAVADAPTREANGQYRIGSKVRVYDGNLKPTGAYFTYSPGKPFDGYDNAVILNFGPPYIDAALFFGKSNAGDADNIGFFRSCIAKSIEWAATAKQNNVRDLMKEITLDEYDFDDSRAVYGLNQPNYYRHEAVYLMFYFNVDADGEGKEGPWLLMRYLTSDDIGRRSPGRFFWFREDDFARLKEMFSESYLAEIDRQEAAWQKFHAEQDALFK